MMNLQDLPSELFDLIIEHLVITIGIQKAVLLCVVNEAFQTPIEQAICVTQVVDIHDPATPDLPRSISPRLRGKIIEVQSRSATASSRGYVRAVAYVNAFLDSCEEACNPQLLQRRREAVAEAVLVNVDGQPYRDDRETLLRNKICGAAVVGSLPILKDLLESSHGCVNASIAQGTTHYFPSPLALAAGAGHIEVVQYLLDLGVDPSEDHTTYHVRELATQSDWNGKDEYIRYWALYPSGREYVSALRAAILGGHDPVVHLLLAPSYRLPLDSLEYIRAILDSATMGRLDLTQQLFTTIGKSISDFPGLSKELLLTATHHNHRNIITWCLTHGGEDINTVRDAANFKKWGPLHTAAATGDSDLAQFLLDEGANINLTLYNSEASTHKPSPIDTAAIHGQEEAVELLLDLGADPARAVYSAVEGGQVRILRSVLRRHPDLIREQDGDFRTSIMVRAMSAGSLPILSLLVGAGVWLDGFEGDAGNSPVKFAKIAGWDWIVEHLIKMGARDVEGVEASKFESTVRGIRVSRRTWEWISKY